MRAILLVTALAACTGSSTVTIDRTNCNTCHTAPTAALPYPDPAGLCTPTEHDTLGYGDNCYACHGTTAWCPADTNHTKWPITQPTASHAGSDCADCHTAITYDPPAITDSTQITCITCHEHDKAQTDAHHVGKGDYSYGPATCMQRECHGGGRRQ